MKVKYEEKFIVINRKYLSNLIIPSKLLKDFINDLELIADYLPKNKYYVCNQDEIYAKDVINIILKGEKNKKQAGNN